MFETARASYLAILDEIREAGLHKDERVITTPQGASIETGGKRVLNFCANNYLGLSSHPAVLEAEAHSLEETVFLVAARAGRIIVLDKAEGPGFLRAAPRVGAAVPGHAPAVGKPYLALVEGAIPMPRGALQRFADGTLPEPSPL